MLPCVFYILNPRCTTGQGAREVTNLLSFSVPKRAETNSLKLSLSRVKESRLWQLCLCHKSDPSTLLLCDDLSGEDQDKFLPTKNLELQRVAGYILIDLEITDPEGFKVAKNWAIVVQGL